MKSGVPERFSFVAGLSRGLRVVLLFYGGDGLRGLCAKVLYGVALITLLFLFVGAISVTPLPGVAWVQSKVVEFMLGGALFPATVFTFWFLSCLDLAFGGLDLGIRPAPDLRSTMVCPPIFSAVSFTDSEPVPALSKSRFYTLWGLSGV